MANTTYNSDSRRMSDSHRAESDLLLHALVNLPMQLDCLALCHIAEEWALVKVSMGLIYHRMQEGLTSRSSDVIAKKTSFGRRI